MYKDVLLKGISPRLVFVIAFLLFLPSIASAGEAGVEAWIDIAKKNSRPLNIARKKIELSEGKVWQARRGLFPEVIFSYEDRAGEISGLEYDGVSYKGKLEQTIFDGKRSVYALSREELELEKAKEEYEKVKGDLVFKVTRAYWELAQAIRSREIFEDISGEVEALLTEAEKILKEELITRQEYLEIKSQFLRTLVRKNTLEKDKKMTLLDFRHLLNQKEEGALDVAEEIPFVPIEVEFAGLWLEAKRNRREWRVSYLDKEIKRLNALIAERERWPEVGLSFSYGSSGEAYKFNRLDLDDEWQVLAKVSLNIGGSSLNYDYDRESLTPVVGSFRGEKLEKHSVYFSLLDRIDKDNEIREKAIRLEEANEQMELEEKRIRREVEEAYYNLKKARVNVEAASMEVSFREKELEIVNLKKGLGKSNMAELVKAKISFGESRVSYLAALAEHIIAVAELEHAVGGL